MVLVFFVSSYINGSVSYKIGRETHPFSCICLFFSFSSKKETNIYQTQNKVTINMRFKALFISPALLVGLFFFFGDSYT